MVSDFKKRFSHYKSTEVIALQGVAILDPRGLNGRNFVGLLLHAKYISCAPHGFREEDILSFPIISLLELLIPGRDQFGPHGLIGKTSMCLDPHLHWCSENGLSPAVKYFY